MATLKNTVMAKLNTLESLFKTDFDAHIEKYQTGFDAHKETKTTDWGYVGNIEIYIS